MPHFDRHFVQTLAWSMLVSFAVSTASGQATGAISGSIVDTASKPISHAFVTALITPTAVSTHPFSTTTATGSSGTFKLSALPAGTFRICVQVPGSNYLDPCQWSTSPPTATIANGQAITIAPIQLTLGYRYQIRFNDPTGAILQNEGSKSGAQLLMYVWAKETSTPVLWGSDDSLGRIYQVLVPIGTSLRFTLQGKKYQVVDQTGAAVNLNAGVTSSLSIGPSAVLSTVANVSATSPDLTYKIVGISP